MTLPLVDTSEHGSSRSEPHASSSGMCPIDRTQFGIVTNFPALASKFSSDEIEAIKKQRQEQTAFFRQVITTTPDFPKPGEFRFPIE